MVTSDGPEGAAAGDGIRRTAESGVLSRVDLENLHKDGFLGNSSGPVLIGQDTVKLHVGNVAWRSLDRSMPKNRVSDDAPIRLAPGDIVTVITQEWVNVPLDLTAC